MSLGCEGNLLLHPMESVFHVVSISMFQIIGADDDCTAHFGQCGGFCGLFWFVFESHMGLGFLFG